MAYILVEDFRGGLDTRRMNVTSTPGTLVELTNAHITRGGEIEKRPAFVRLATLPSNTTGLAAAGGQIYVFGSVAASSVVFATGIPSNINYVRLQHPSGEALTDILSVDFYNGKVYAAAQFADGRIYHYYDGTRITDWFDGRARVTVQINTGSVGGVRATASLTITGGTNNPGCEMSSLKIGGVDLIATSVQHTGDNSSTATNVAAAVNAGASGWTATASGGVVSMTAPAVGTAYNSLRLQISAQNGFIVPYTGLTQYSSGGIDNAITNLTVNGVSIIGSQIVYSSSHSALATALAEEINSFPSSPEFEATSINQFVNIISKTSGSIFNNQSVAVTTSGDVTTIFDPTSQNYIDGGADASSVNGYTPGGFVRPIKTKMYALSDSLLHYSGVDQPTEWNNSAVGAGFINLSNNAKGSEDLKAVASYFNNIAVLAEQCVQIWFVDADDTKNQLIQVLQNTGTIAPDSVVEFGDNDVFYLSLSGLRSLKSRDSSNAAFVGDIGNPIDSLISADIQANRASAELAKAVLEPRDGRYMIAIDSKIYVFSFFPSSKVSAWSVYEPGFVVDRWAYDGKQTLCRTGNGLYSFGGENGNTYDSCEVTVQMPFLDGGNPAMSKDFHAIDVTCENTWSVSVATDPQNIELVEDLGTVTQTTYSQGRASMVGYSTHVAPKLTCTQAGPAKLGNVAIHYDGAESG